MPTGIASRVCLPGLRQREAPADQPGGRTQECALGFCRGCQKPRIDLPIRVGNITTRADGMGTKPCNDDEHSPLLSSTPLLSSLIVCIRSCGPSTNKQLERVFRLTIPTAPHHTNQTNPRPDVGALQARHEMQERQIHTCAALRSASSVHTSRITIAAIGRRIASPQIRHRSQIQCHWLDSTRPSETVRVTARRYSILYRPGERVSLSSISSESSSVFPL